MRGIDTMLGRHPRSRGRVLSLASALLGLALSLVATPALGRPDPGAHRLLVVYRASGPHALGACAESLFRRRASMAASSADRSDSLDRWQARHRVKDVRALFRRPDGSSLAEQRAHLMQRLTAKAAGRSARGRRVATSASLERRAATLAHAYSIDLPAESDVAVALDELRADPHVAYAQWDHAHALDALPNDPYLVSQGSWGQDYPDLWGLDRIRVQEAWQTTRGAGQVVAVVDTGLDYDHPDIAANVWINPGEDLNANGVVDDGDWNGLDDDGNGFVDDLRGYDFAGFSGGDEERSGGDPDPFDPHGHGTHVAGTIAAVANNGIGIAGVAPEARVMPLKGFGDEGSGRDSDLWAAVLYAIENGADVVNASWSCSPPCPDNPLARDVLAVAAEAGVVFVTSAGNEEFDVVRNEPERTTAAITVGSLGEDDRISSFSNRGWLLDLLAPGGGPVVGGVVVGARNILSLAASTLPPLEELFRVGDAYYRLSGTSMAAPHVTGAVALLRSVRPELSVDDVRRLLRISARDLGPIGHDPENGAGALDLPSLLVTALPDLTLAFVSPSPGALLDPRSGPLTITVRAGGRDAVGFSLARSRGLSNPDFESVAEWTEGDGAERAVVWDASTLEAGPQVLRLRAELDSGAVVDEFLVVGLESIRPKRLSSGSFHELQPDVSGSRVVWQAQTDAVPRIGRIVTGGFARSGDPLEPVVLDERPERSQTGPRIDDGRVVWKEQTPGSPSDDLIGCRSAGRSGRNDCAAETIVSVPQRLDPFDFAKSTVLWSDPDAGRDIVGCRWPHRGACVARELGSPLPSVSSRLLAFDGETVLWRTNERAAQVQFCRLRKSDLGCEPIVVQARSPSISRADSADIDDDLLAVELFDLSGSQLAHCRLDRTTGACALRIVQGVRDGRTPAVSGRRIVWTEKPDGEDASIVFCELDPIDDRCRRQRLTGAPYPTGAPRIDGNRIVWEDERVGPVQVLGLGLPEIRVTRHARLAPGIAASIPMTLSGAADDSPWRFELEPIEGLTPAEVDARVVAGARSSVARLTLRPYGILAGRSGRWRIRAISPDGLETRASIEFFIDLPARRR